jgi:hypothetical protein
MNMVHHFQPCQEKGREHKPNQSNFLLAKYTNIATLNKVFTRIKLTKIYTYIFCQNKHYSKDLMHSLHTYHYRL